LLVLFFFLTAREAIRDGAFLLSEAGLMRLGSSVAYLDISWARVGEGPIRRMSEGGSEWELIKILLEGDEGSYKMNTASSTCLRLTTQIGQVHVATGVLQNLGTNQQPHRPENAAEHQTSSPLTNTGQTGEHHRPDRSLLVRVDDFH
jgi:hypothetical protein